MGSNKAWSEAEIDYIEDKWGSVSIPAMAKKLNRTEIAIDLKATRLGLGRFTESGDYVTYSQLVKALGFGKNTGYRNTSWIKNRNFPVKTKKIKKQVVKVVKLDDFWRWAEKNKNFLDFANFEKNMLGKEPAWVDEKRRYDIEKNTKYKKCEWTRDEEEKLKYLLREQKYSYKEVASRLNRSVGSIMRRIDDLNLKERPIREISKKWRQEEIDEIEYLIKKGWDMN